MNLGEVSTQDECQVPAHVREMQLQATSAVSGIQNKSGNADECGSPALLRKATNDNVFLGESNGYW